MTGQDRVILALDERTRSGILTCINILIKSRFDGGIVQQDLHDLWVARLPASC